MAAAATALLLLVTNAGGEQLSSDPTPILQEALKALEGAQTKVGESKAKVAAALEALKPKEEPPPTGIVIWKADAKQSSLPDPEGILHEWGTIGAQETSRVKRVPNLDAADGGAAVPGGKAFRYETRVGDSAYGERAETRMGNPNATPPVTPPQYREGDTRGFALQVYVPPSFPINNTGFDVIAQWHQTGGNASPPWQIDVQGGRFVINTDVMQHDEPGGTGIIPWSASASALTGKWVKFAFEAYFGVTNGWLETYVDEGNGQGMLKRGSRIFIPTVKWTQGTTTVKPTFSCLGSYRGNYAFTGPQHFYATSYVIATNRLAAEQAAGF